MRQHVHLSYVELAGEIDGMRGDIAKIVAPFVDVDVTVGTGALMGKKLYRCIACGHTRRKGDPCVDSSC